MRHNFVFFVLANGFLLWDFHCMAYFSYWRTRVGAAARLGGWAVAAATGLLTG